MWFVYHVAKLELFDVQVSTFYTSVVNSVMHVNHVKGCFCFSSMRKRWRRSQPYKTMGLGWELICCSHGCVYLTSGQWGFDVIVLHR